MDKLLKPERLNADPAAADADKTWNHWKTTFDNFIGSFTGDNALSGSKKLAALTNYVSGNVYSYISSADEYDDAIAILQDMYIKPKNEVYVRHCLSSRKQLDGETVNQFMHSLVVLSKECTFKSASAAVYRDEYVRDSFIRGLQSNEIRQRLLEECEDRQKTFTKARTLEAALKSSEQSQNKTYTCSTFASERQPQENCCDAINPKPNRSASNVICYISCFPNHKCSVCPANDSTCYACGFKGHFSNVCKTGKPENRSTSGESPQLPTAACLPPSSQSDAVVNSKSPQLDKSRGSIFQLFDDPYRGGEPRRLTLADKLPKVSLGSGKKRGTRFPELTRQQTQELRKQILYNGEYRVLNISLLTILSLVIFGIVFMSVWHYNNQNFWVLYLVLGLILGGIGISLMAVKFYFYFKRYHGSGARSDKGVTDLIFVNLGFNGGSGSVGTGGTVEKVLVEEQSDVQ